MITSIRKRRFLFSYRLLAGLLVLHALAAPGQSVDQGDSLTLEQVGAQIETLKSDTTINDTLRNTILQNLQQASANLKQAKEFEDATADFAQQIKQAPTGIAAIKQELAAPAPQVKIEDDPDKPLAGWEKELLQATADANTAKQKLGDLETEDQRRSARRSELPPLLSTATARHAELTEKLALPADPAKDPNQNTLLTQSSQWVLLSELQETDAEATSYEQELQGNDIYRELLAARRDRAERNRTVAEARVNALQLKVDQQRHIESENEATKAKEARKAAAQLHSAIQSIADRNAALAAMRTGEDGLTANLRHATRELQQSKAMAATVQSREDELQQRIKAAGLTHAVAQLLRRDRDLLPDIRPYRTRIRERRDTIANVQIELLDFNDERSALLDIDSKAAALAAANSNTEQERSELTAVLKEYLTAQRDQLDSLIADNNTYFSVLLDLDRAEQQLVNNVSLFSELIAEQILWVRSDSFIGLQTFRNAAAGFTWLMQPSHWKDVAGALWVDFLKHPLSRIVLVLIEILLIIYYRFAGRRLKAIATATNRIRTDRFTYTLEALLHTVLRAAPIPLALLFLGWRLNHPDVGDDFTQAMGSAFKETSLILALILSLYEACRPSGLIEVHFGWDRPAMKRARHALIQLTLICSPLIWISGVLGNCTSTPEIKALERILFSLFHLILVVFVAIWLKLKPGFMTRPFTQVADPGPLKLRQFFLTMALCILVLILVADVVGYYYSALQMWRWFAESIALVILVFMIEGLLQRSFRVVARRVDFERRVKARQDEGDAPPDEEGLDVVAISERTRNLLRVGVRIALLFGLWFIWSGALPALNLLDRVVLWTIQTDSETGGQTIPMVISLMDLFTALFVAVLTVITAKNLPGLLDISILRKLPIAYGERYAITTIIRYITVAVGVALAFSKLGIGWNKIRLIIAGLSVGLGFGLQEIFANFISGLILLFERPIRVRDYVTVGTTSGQVSRIQIRATTITDFDNKELLIPNKQFINGELINWTLTNPVLRVVVPVGIAYGSDTEKAVQILMEVAKNYCLVIPDPAPTACFVNFGESSLNFELRAFIAQADHFREAKHELNMAVDAAFRKAGIEIAFPQRDLHIRSVAPVIRPEDIIHQEPGK